MPLPTNADYQGAIQNPHQCFKDYQLMYGVPVLNNWGLPIATTGNFAAVFQIVSNEKKYAVKCFTRYQPEQEERYAIISSYLQNKNLPYMVDFTFLKQGIRLQGKWYPILKMEWIEGDTLGSYIDKKINSSLALRKLADKFLELTNSLHSHSIAHGDLQHGNIIVVDNDLCLVDYDGMFVPGLEGKEAAETGHPNYQHLGRDKHFGPFLDSFSIWVIYLSLVALSADPNLRKNLNLDEECLVFRKPDFLSPETSETFRALDKSPDQNVRDLVLKFRSLIYSSDLTQLPQLGANIPRYWIPDAKLVPTPIEKTKSFPIQPNAATALGADEIGASWISDHQFLNIKKFTFSCKLERLTIILGLLSVLAVIIGDGFALFLLNNTELWLLGSIALITGGVIFFECISIVLFLIMRYNLLPEVKEKRTIEKEFRILKENTNILAGSKGLKMLDNDRSQLEKNEKKELKLIITKQQENAIQEKDELSKIDDELKKTLMPFRTQESELQAAENSELEKALQDYQNSTLRRYLEQYDISTSTLPGFGPVLKRRLLLAGYRTAADIHSYINVYGIGPVKTNDLLVWRKQIERGLMSKIPRSLSPQQQEAIKARYRSRLTGIRTEEARCLNYAEHSRKKCREKHSQISSTLSKAFNDTQNRYLSRRQEIDQKVTVLKKKLTEKQLELSKRKRDLVVYRRINFKGYLYRIITGS